MWYVGSCIPLPGCDNDVECLTRLILEPKLPTYDEPPGKHIIDNKLLLLEHCELSFAAPNRPPPPRHPACGVATSGSISQSHGLTTQATDVSPLRTPYKRRGSAIESFRISSSEIEFAHSKCPLFQHAKAWPSRSKQARKSRSPIHMASRCLTSLHSTRMMLGSICRWFTRGPSIVSSFSTRVTSCTTRDGSQC